MLPEPTAHSRAPVLPPKAVRIGLIDTDSAFVQVLVNRFEAMEWQYRSVAGPLPPEELLALRLNSVVLDLAHLGPEAWSYLSDVCEALPELAIVVCTGRSTVAQRVRGLRMGADDWVTKPCHPEEVIARVEAAVRRRQRAQASGYGEPISAGELEIRADQFQAFVHGRAAELTRREFEVLQVLAESEDQVVQREELYQRVWGYAMAHGDRSVDVFVRKVRQKLERLSPDWNYIHTHFGIGYRFQAEAKPESGHGLPTRAQLDPRRAKSPATA